MIYNLNILKADETRMVIGMSGKIVRLKRQDTMKRVLEYKRDLLTTENYRNMINTYLLEQVLTIQDQIHLPQKRSINLQPFVKYLSKFKYKQALDIALKVILLIMIINL